MRRPPIGNTEQGVLRAVHSGELEIDAQGRVWRVARRAGLKRGGVQLLSVPRRRAERKPGRCGYHQMVVYWDHKVYTAQAHRLVWLYYHGAIPTGKQINHKNGIKTDNRPENLELVTASQNKRHAHRIGLWDQRGERNNAARRTNADMRRLRELYATGQYQQKDLAAMFSMPFQSVSRVVKGDIYLSAGGPIALADNRHDGCEHDPITGRFAGPRQ